MDLVDWDEARFREIESGFAAMAERLGISDSRAIPLSALNGDNVVDASGATPWFDGEPLLAQLEQLEVAEDRNLEDVRFPVQLTIRDTDYRGYAGRVAGGVLRTGDEVLVLPAGETTTIARIDTPRGPVESVEPPLAATIVLADELDVGRGDMICGPANPPAVARHLEATVCWMAEEPLRAGARYELKHTTRRVRATIEEIQSRVDMATLDSVDRPDGLELNDIGQVRLRTTVPLLADPYSRNRVSGAFILVDETTFETVGAGMIATASEEAGRPVGPHSPDVVWHDPPMPRRDRWNILGVRGATIWLTGLPGAGKSTIGEELERRLIAAGRPAYLLDGENLRHGLSADLGFSDADRHEHARRAANVAQHPRRHGQRRDRRARLADGGRPRLRARAARAGRPALRRGLGRHPAGRVRAARPRRALPASLGGRADGLHRGRRALRGARAARRAPARRRRAGRALGRAPARGARPGLSPRALSGARGGSAWRRRVRRTGRAARSPTPSAVSRGPKAGSRSERLPHGQQQPAPVGELGPTR